MLLHSLFSQHRFHLLAVMNDASVNIGVFMPLCFLILELTSSPFTSKKFLIKSECQKIGGPESFGPLLFWPWWELHGVSPPWPLQGSPPWGPLLGSPQKLPVPTGGDLVMPALLPTSQWVMVQRPGGGIAASPQTPPMTLTPAMSSRKGSGLALLLALLPACPRDLGQSP